MCESFAPDCIDQTRARNNVESPESSLDSARGAVDRVGWSARSDYRPQPGATNYRRAMTPERQLVEQLRFVPIPARQRPSLPCSRTLYRVSAAMQPTQ